MFKYSVRLIDPELLHGLGKDYWSMTITANSLQGAWGKFCKQKKAPIFQFGLSHDTPRSCDYDVRIL